jgi:hypothetical protein
MKTIQWRHQLVAALTVGAVLLATGAIAQGAIAQNWVYVAVWGDYFPGSGTLIKVDLGTMSQTTVQTGFYIPSGVTFFPNGDVCFADTGNGILYRVSPSGATTPFLTGLNNPSNPYFTSWDTCVAPQFGAQCCTEVNLAGAVVNTITGTTFGGFDGPVSVRSMAYYWSEYYWYYRYYRSYDPIAEAGYEENYQRDMRAYAASRGQSPGRVDVLKHNPDGTWTQEQPLATNLNYAYDAVPDQAGNVFVSEEGNGRILKFPVAADGTVSTNPVVFAKGLSPVGLAFDRAGSLYEADLGGVINKFLFSNGTLSTNPVAVVTNLSAPAYLAFPPPPIVGISRAGGSVVLRWADALYALQSAAVLTGTFTNVDGATSPYTNATTGGARFFRLESK